MLTYREFAKYGVQTTFYFALEDVTDTEAPFTGAAPVTGDIWISKDGGAAANATNAFVAISNGLYSWTATATEMQATRLIVNVYDATASAIFRPICVLILTKLQLGQIDVDSTQIGGSANAMLLQGASGGTGLKAVGGANGNGIWGATSSGNGFGIVGTGVGTGDGINGTGGATGDGIAGDGGATSGAGMSGTATAGNSSGILATGRGTGQGLNVAHATDNSLMTNIFDTLEGSEPSAAIASNATFKQIYQFLKRRFFNLVTQTSSVQTIYKDDSVTSLTTLACSNDGTTQSKGKSS